MTYRNVDTSNRLHRSHRHTCPGIREATTEANTPEDCDAYAAALKEVL